MLYNITKVLFSSFSYLEQPSIVEKVNMMLITRETTENNQSFKIPLILSSTNQVLKVSKKSVWQKMVPFQMKKLILTLLIFFLQRTSLCTLIMATYLLSRVVS